MTSERLNMLFARYLEQTLSHDERLELMGLFLEPSLQLELERLAENAWHQTGEEEGMPPEKRTLIMQTITDLSSARIEPASPRIRSLWWRPLAVAASILLLIGLGTYYLFFNNNSTVDSQQKTAETTEVKAPQTNRATITLADGRKVYLDSAANGQLAVQGNVKLVKLAKGELAYQATTVERGKVIQYNTLFNPIGSQVTSMTLSDGTRVWLNAGSSLTYPVAFTGTERKVSITGESYFEVAHNAAMPFKVSKGDVAVQVLGTHFNVNAYDDEPDIRVTLLKGAVKVLKGNAYGVLKPGQQAQVTNTLKIANSIDLDQVMAWKEGEFRFNNTNIGEVMRQVARWYDVQIEYEGNFTDLNFGGSVSRQENVSALLKRLEATEAVKFRVEGRKIVVLP